MRMSQANFRVAPQNLVLQKSLISNIDPSDKVVSPRQRVPTDSKTESTSEPNMFFSTLEWMMSSSKVPMEASNQMSVSCEGCGRTEKGSLPRLLWHSLGIICCYSLYGFLLERITITKYGEDGERFNTYFVLLFCTCTFNMVVARAALFFRPWENEAYVPQHNFMIVSVTYVGAMYGSATALKYVNYPTQVLAKSCKMIPVMMMGVILGKKYTRKKYFIVALITTGVALFIFKPSAAVVPASIEPTSVPGLLLSLFSLTCDGFTSAFEEKVVSVWNPSTLQMMLFTNSYASIITFGLCFLHGELHLAVSFFSLHHSCASDILMYAMAGSMGQIFIFSTIREFGALVCSTATTLRKFFTVIWSIFWFGHKLYLFQVFGAIVVFLGLGIDLHDRYAGSRQIFELPTSPMPSSSPKGEPV